MKIIQMIPKKRVTKPENYASFYGLLKQLPGCDKEALKAEIVLQFTEGRTDSLVYSAGGGAKSGGSFLAKLFK